jgi:myo-inositol 2-dehydrogenase/D-chiro-inositol 1-dehydrogenase
VTKLTRRMVLQGGTAAAAIGLAKTLRPVQEALAQDAKQTSAEVIRVGFIGVGHRGTDVLKEFLKVDGQRVVAICDLDQDQANHAAALVKEAQGHTADTYVGDRDTFHRVLERKDVDAIYTATPCYEHPRVMLATIAADKHIYGEKPLALTVADADSIIAAAKAKRDLVVQVGFQWMANATMVDAVKRARDGQIGRLIEGRFFRHNGAHPLTGWFGRRQQSGDWMLEQACHEYNIMNWVADATPVRAYGLGRNDLYTDLQPERNVTDYYAVILEYPNGLIVHYAHGWISPKHFTGISMIAVGSEGAVDIGNGRISLRDEKATVEPIAKQEISDTQSALAAFLDSIREHKPAVAPVSNGRNAVLTGLLVRKAVYERRPVSWGEMLSTC